MEIKHTDNKKEGAFYIERHGQRIAEMSYQHSGDHQITIDHTEVDPELKGQGIGHKLFEEAVDYLRKNNYKAIAECRFVASVFNKNPQDYQDIMAS